jgi:hypothetical protein
MEGARLAPQLAKGPLLSAPMLPRIKQGFVGSEGTLGVVTGAVLRLAPLPTRRATAWLKLAWGARRSPSSSP